MRVLRRDVESEEPDERDQWKKESKSTRIVLSTTRPAHLFFFLRSRFHGRGLYVSDDPTYGRGEMSDESLKLRGR